MCRIRADGYQPVMQQRLQRPAHCRVGYGQSLGELVLSQRSQLIERAQQPQLAVREAVVGGHPVPGVTAEQGNHAVQQIGKSIIHEFSLAGCCINNINDAR